MPARLKTVQFVLLPVRGLRAASEHAAMQRFFLSLAAPQPGASLAAIGLRVVDSIHEDGAKLVEIAPGAISALRAQQFGARLAPVRYYRTARAARQAVEEAPKKAASAARIVLKVVSSKDGSPVAGATVVAFIDFQKRIGAQGVTGKRGEVGLSLGAARRTLERVYVYPGMGFWSSLRRGFDATSGAEIALEPIDPSAPDVVRHFYGNAADGAGNGVTVGVVDTGIGPHPDLVVDGGRNTVVGEDATDFTDNGALHGTHVGGIIASRGKAPTGVRGLAPGVRLRCYRVFGKKAESASNYSIAKAVDAAVSDGCDLINMSLGGGSPDDVLRAAIEDARAAGSVVIVAAGNDGGPVSFPASDSMALAVSAFGRKGTFPAGTTESGDAAAPYGTDKANFFASFSNRGQEIDLTGPGVGVVSTVPGGDAAGRGLAAARHGLGVMSGTSMACPAVTGRAAFILAGRPDLLSLPRGEERSSAMAHALLQSAAPLGFGPLFEGQGMLK